MQLQIMKMGRIYSGRLVRHASLAIDDRDGRKRGARGIWGAGERGGARPGAHSSRPGRNGAGERGGAKRARRRYPAKGPREGAAAGDAGEPCSPGIPTAFVAGAIEAGVHIQASSNLHPGAPCWRGARRRPPWT